MTNLLQVGVIGCGALGLTHIRRLGQIGPSATERVVVAAVSDPSAVALSAAITICGIDTPAYEDFHDLLKQDLDAVLIASPDGFHVEQVLAAFDHGLDVLCEKPLTPSLEQWQKVIEARDKSGKHLALTYPRRYSASLRAAHREIRSGKWGNVTSVTIYNGEDWITPNRGTWRHDPVITPGGFFYDASGHQLDCVFWLTGLQGESLSAQVSNRSTPVPIVITGQASLTGGVPLIFAFVGDAHVWREEIHIHCEHTDFAVLNEKAYQVRDGDLMLLGESELDENSVEAFVRLVRGEGPNSSPVEDVEPLIRFTAAALRSAEVSAPVTLSNLI